MTQMLGAAGMSSPLNRTPQAASSSSSPSHPVQGNFRGLFANDWATEDKISLLTETYTIFSSLQKIAADEVARQQTASLHNRSAATSLLPSVQTLQYYRRISGLYRDALKRYTHSLESAELGAASVEEEVDLELSQWLHTILHFVETIYVPSDGRGTGVVGEEILHWLNSFDFAPQTEEGQEIAQSATPHDHPSYWPYILCCVLRGFHSTAASLLSSLSNTHPSLSLQKVAIRAAKLLSSMPRSTSFTLEHDFISAHRKWLAQVRSLLSGLEQDMDEMERELNASPLAESKSAETLEDERLEFEAQFRCLLELMGGVQTRVFEACDNWKEALGAWGVLIQPGLKRDDVPEAMQAIVSHFTFDSTLSHEAILVALAQGEVTKACQLTVGYDPWLAAHMTDLLDRVGVLDDQDWESVRPMRLRYLEEYAETVLDDQGLWRLAVDYLSYCGPSARRRMQSVVLDVPIIGPHARPSRREVKRAEEVEAEAEDAAMDEGASDPEEAAEERRARKEAERVGGKVSDEFDVAMELIQTCIDLNMDLEARAICKKMAAEMTREKRYGPALAYCVRANDMRQLKRIVAEVLLQYIQEGVEPFCQAVDSIPPSLFHSGSKETNAMDVDNLSRLVLASGPGMQSSRLAFLALYRDFHHEYATNHLTQAASLLVELLTSASGPENFWAVMLVDAIPLLQDVEQDYFSKEQAFELLRILDQVTTASAIHPIQAQHYLGLLEQLLVGPTKAKEQSGVSDQHGNPGASFDVHSATARLDVLRLALARRLARMSS